MEVEPFCLNSACLWPRMLGPTTQKEADRRGIRITSTRSRADPPTFLSAIYCSSMRELIRMLIAQRI